MREQMSGPDLHVFTLFWGQIKFIYFFFYKKGIMQLFSADAILFSKKKDNFLFHPEKVKNRPQKLLIIGPDHFISQSSPDHSPELIFHIMKSRDQTSVLLSVY